MKTFGFLIIFVSLVFGLYAFNMDVSVPTHLGRVVNIHLVTQQQNYLYISGIGLLIGIVLSFFVKTTKEDKTKKIENNKTKKGYEKSKTEKGFNYKLYITESITFDVIKNKIYSFYSEQSFIKKNDNENTLFIKNDEQNAYVEVKNMDDYIKVSVWNTVEPSFMENLYLQNNKEKNENNKIADIDKLIELGKLYKDNLITKEEFEEQKRLLKK